MGNEGWVLNMLKHPCFYLMETDKGISIRCNQRHYLKTREKVLINLNVDYKIIIPLEDTPALHGKHPEFQRTNRI